MCGQTTTDVHYPVPSRQSLEVAQQIATGLADLQAREDERGEWAGRVGGVISAHSGLGEATSTGHQPQEGWVAVGREGEKLDRQGEGGLRYRPVQLLYRRPAEKTVSLTVCKPWAEQVANLLNISSSC